MNAELIKKAEKVRAQLIEISEHISGSSGYYEDVEKWVRENASQEIANSYFSFEYEGKMYDAGSEADTVSDYIFPLEEGFKEFRFKTMRDEDIKILIEAMEKINKYYANERDKVEFLVSCYADAVGYEA